MSVSVSVDHDRLNSSYNLSLSIDNNQLTRSINKKNNLDQDQFEDDPIDNIFIKSN